MTTASYFPVLDSLQISPQVIYDLLEHGIEAERVKFFAEKIIDAPDFYCSYLRILQGERLLCFMRRGIRASEVTNHLP